ncbi:MAG: hypothetical protein L6311_06310 [Cellulomonas sp.]|nr:hypothetical protein [Cellulomonas sp.]
MTRDLTSDPAAQHLAEATPAEASLRAADARIGGDPARAPRSLSSAELESDDEALASAQEYDEPEAL